MVVNGDHASCHKTTSLPRARNHLEPIVSWLIIVSPPCVDLYSRAKHSSLLVSILNLEDDNAHTHSD